VEKDTVGVGQRSSRSRSCSTTPMTKNLR